MAHGLLPRACAASAAPAATWAWSASRKAWTQAGLADPAALAGEVSAARNTEGAGSQLSSRRNSRTADSSCRRAATWSPLIA